MNKKETAKKRTSWKSIIGGDILTTEFFRRQIKLLLILFTMAIIYISNDYYCDQKRLDIDRLKSTLEEIKHKASDSETKLTEKTRQSYIEEYLSRRKSNLQTSTEPLIVID
ncbi:MAG: hypothetical protein LBN06_07530 [Prevotellaceae bacterium]|jgi:hypothetical protein|nr:hypothetical protein [Prevotellaceae bacterium]